MTFRSRSTPRANVLGATEVPAMSRARRVFPSGESSPHASVSSCLLARTSFATTDLEESTTRIRRSLIKRK